MRWPGVRDRADQQQLGFPPGWARKQRCEGNEQGYNGIGQGEHGWAFPLKVGSGQLTLSLYFSKLCVKPSLENDTLGCDGISSSQVSRICQQLDEVVDSFLGRPWTVVPTPTSGWTA